MDALPLSQFFATVRVRLDKADARARAAYDAVIARKHAHLTREQEKALEQEAFAAARAVQMEAHEGLRDLCVSLL